jgi:hypothetical protein
VVHAALTRSNKLESLPALTAASGASRAAPAREPIGSRFCARSVGQGQILAHELLAQISAIDYDSRECSPVWIVPLPADVDGLTEAQEVDDASFRPVSGHTLAFTASLTSLGGVDPEETDALSRDSDRVAVDHVDLACVNRLGPRRPDEHD